MKKEEIKVYTHTHPDAMTVRVTVFVEEQGFHDEFDETDGVAVHFVAYADGNPVGTCRVFAADGGYILGRLAVVKPHRGLGFGKALLSAAETHVESIGGESLSLHSQLRASGFYAKCGYAPFGEPDEEEGCPHIWMKKRLGGTT